MIIKSILFSSAVLMLLVGTTASASAGPSGTYAASVKGSFVDDDGSHPVRAKGTLKLTSGKAELTVLNPSGNQGRSLLRLSKPIDPTASTQKIKGTIKDLKFKDGRGTFAGKLVRSGRHYKLTADMRMTYSDGVMKGTVVATK